MAQGAAAFKDQLAKLTQAYLARVKSVTWHLADLVLESIQYGSKLTGAAGQPVDTSALRESWRIRWESAYLAHVETNIEYAQPIEDGIGPHGPLTLRSKVGGFHSVKMTRAGYKRLVVEATKRAKQQAVA